MANIFPAVVKMSPSFNEPELILTYAQASGAFEALPGGKPRVKLGTGDLAVYINTLDVRTQSQAGQATGNLLPSAALIANYIQTLTYLIRVRANWDRHDIAAAANYSVSLPAAQDLAMKQGIFQQMRTALLYGFNPSNNEGLLNATGKTSVPLPADSQGNQTLMTYDNGEFALWLLGQMVLMISGMYQTGGKVKPKVVFVSPQRVFLQLQLANVVELVSFQRPGAGTATVAEMVKTVAASGGVEVEWVYDDTLIGQGGGATIDAVLMTMPEIEVPSEPGINTNAFAELQPNMKAVNAMYADMAAPIKIPTSIPDGGITEVQEIRVTSGWNLRPQGVYVLQIPYQ